MDGKSRFSFSAVLVAPSLGLCMIRYSFLRLEHLQSPAHPERRLATLGKDHVMMSKKVAMSCATSRPSGAVQLLLIAAIGFWSGAVSASAEEGDSAALAAAMKNATATLQDGLKASEPQGTPISAKFEIEDGKLQLSVYTIKSDGFTEVVADPKTGAISKAEKITDADDLKEAASQKAAMAKAKVSLLSAAEAAVKANAGSRAVSIVPELKNGQTTAEVTLLAGNAFKKVTEKLD
jgi:hypothetical protein